MYWSDDDDDDAIDQTGGGGDIVQDSMYDGRFKTPLTGIIVGPTGCGKSTFVSQLIREQDQLLTQNFDYLFIFIGTQKINNPIWLSLEKDQHLLPHTVTIFEVNTLYPGEEMKKLKQDFETLVDGRKQKNQRGCVIFDDLMSELAEHDMLADLFSRVSSHKDLSVIHITQNLFHQGSRSSNHGTIFRNTKFLVMFCCPMDNSVLNTVATRVSPKPGQRTQFRDMLKWIVEKYRYVVVTGDFSTPSELKIRSDIFAKQPIPFQRIFMLRDRATVKKKV